MPYDVTTDTTSISGLAKQFEAFKTEVDDALKDLDGIKIQAGDFTEADDLEKTVVDRTAELKKNLTGLSKALDDISTNLTTIAGKYTDVAAQNDMDADALDDLVSALEKDLPILNK